MDSARWVVGQLSNYLGRSSVFHQYEVQSSTLHVLGHTEYKLPDNAGGIQQRQTTDRLGVAVLQAPLSVRPSIVGTHAPICRTADGRRRSRRSSESSTWDAYFVGGTKRSRPHRKASKYSVMHSLTRLVVASSDGMRG